jgi:hypothetical protein
LGSGSGRGAFAGVWGFVWAPAAAGRAAARAATNATQTILPDTSTGAGYSTVWRLRTNTRLLPSAPGHRGPTDTSTVFT